MKFSDRVVAAGLRQGDPKAFHILFETFFPKVFNYTFFHLADQQRAEKVTEEILSEAVETIGQYHTTAACSLTEWLFRITRRHMLARVPTHTVARAGRFTPTGEHTEFFRLEEMLLGSVVQG